jgi:hypothetical protein
MKDGREVTRITDPKTVARVVGLVDRYRDGWVVPWYGPPVADTIVVFYAHGHAIGDFGIGSDFVTRTYGGFYSRRIPSGELAGLRAALDHGRR